MVAVVAAAACRGSSNGTSNGTWASNRELINDAHKSLCLQPVMATTQTQAAAITNTNTLSHTIITSIIPDSETQS